jgi:uncharacterized membrane protein HdeD (DUF308 family)
MFVCVISAAVVLGPERIVQGAMEIWADRRFREFVGWLLLAVGSLLGIIGYAVGDE